MVTPHDQFVGHGSISLTGNFPHTHLLWMSLTVVITMEPYHDDHWEIEMWLLIKQSLTWKV